MRIRRIRLACYRGVDEQELVFSDGEDVTVVQGPNEVGKSCLSEAVDVLFECRDDSRARRVRSLQPVGRDVGTEVEMDVTSGPYEFTYRKRYNRDRLTELEVRSPVPENHTGREAHDRAREILEETVDVALWKALRIHQGLAVSQASVGQNASLATALDHAAGEPADGATDENESLFEAVTEEFLRYFTATGRERREVGALRGKLERAEQRAAELAERRTSLDADVVLCSRLSAERARLDERGEELAREAERWRSELDAVESLREAAESARLRHEAATSALEVARGRAGRRAEQVRRVGELQADHARAGAELDDLARSIETFRAELAQAESTLHGLQAKEGEARRAAELARIDYEHWSDREELEELGKRKERIQRAREEAADAQALLATSRVTTEAVDRIQEAYNQLLVTRAVVRSKSASLRLEALADLGLEVGGEPMQLRAGEEREDAVTAPLEVTLPGLLRISIQPGEDFTEVRRNLDRARNEYTAACQEIGVDDLETALALLKQRQRAEAKVAERDQTMRSELGSGWTEALEVRQEELKRRVFTYLRERGPGEPMPADRDSALATLRTAEAALEEVRSGRETVSARMEALRARGEELAARRNELAARTAVLAADLEATRTSLAEARASESDEELQAGVEAARAQAESLQRLHEHACEDLAGKGPEVLRERALNAEGALAKLRRELREVETEHTEVSARVKLLCEEGLAEKFDAAETERLHLSGELERLEGRARAAALLFHTMRARREEARRAYVRPLRERVETLGRIVFGAGFAVDLDDDLRIATRTLGGKTLAFDELSTGTREQLGIIARLACAMIVAEDGSGVPVILDDALGYSDPDRLREMGAVLSVAGRHLQVIVLTSVPDRYLHVGGARVVRLS